MVLEESDKFLFLFGSGFGFFIALLAWGNQIKSLRIEVLDLEKSFCEKHGMNREVFISLVRGKNCPFDDRHYTFDQKMEAIRQLINKKMTDNKTMEIIEKIKEYHSIRYTLEILHKCKYFMSVLICYFLFCCSVLVLKYSSLFDISAGLFFIMLLTTLSLMLLGYIYENRAVDFFSNILDSV